MGGVVACVEEAECVEVGCAGGEGGVCEFGLPEHLGGHPGYVEVG